MAERFGGKYSPDNSNPANSQRGTSQTPQSRKPKRFTSRLWLIRFFALLFGLSGAFSFLSGAPESGLIKIIALVGIWTGTHIIKAGVEAEDAYNARSIARPPGLPRKLIGSVLIGLSLGAVGVIATELGLSGLFMGVAAGVGSLFAFGLDPLKSKGLRNHDEHDAARVAKAVDNAEALLKDIEQTAKSLRNHRLTTRVERLADSARAVFREVENDPRDLNTARKYLTVYLMGARDATEKYAALARKNGMKDSIENDYQTLLDDLEASFRAKRQTLLNDNTSDLDIEITVLRKRLQTEGITLSEGEKE